MYICSPEPRTHTLTRHFFTSHSPSLLRFLVRYSSLEPYTVISVLNIRLMHTVQLCTFHLPEAKTKAAYWFSLTKNAAWGKFSSCQSNPFGTAQKLFTCIYSTPHEIKIVLYCSEASEQRNLEFLTEHVYG